MAHLQGPSPALPYPIRQARRGLGAPGAEVGFAPGCGRSARLPPGKRGETTRPCWVVGSPAYRDHPATPTPSGSRALSSRRSREAQIGQRRPVQSDCRRRFALRPFSPLNQATPGCDDRAFQPMFGRPAVRKLRWVFLRPLWDNLIPLIASTGEGVPDLGAY